MSASPEPCTLDTADPLSADLCLARFLSRPQPPNIPVRQIREADRLGTCRHLRCFALDLMLAPTCMHLCKNRPYKRQRNPSRGGPIALIRLHSQKVQGRARERAAPSYQTSKTCPNVAGFNNVCRWLFMATAFAALMNVFWQQSILQRGYRISMTEQWGDRNTCRRQG